MSPCLTPFHDKEKNSVYPEIKGNFDLINSFYKNPTANIIIDKKDKVFSLRSGTKGCPPHITSFQYPTGNSSVCSTTSGKGIYSGKEEIKLLLFTDNVIVYKENPQRQQNSWL